MAEARCPKQLRWGNERYAMKKISFFGYKKTDAEKICAFSVWKKFIDFSLDGTVVQRKSELEKHILQNQTDILFLCNDLIDGFSAEEIKKLVQKFAKVQIIVVSRDISYEKVRKFLTNGCFDYLQNPMDEKKIEELLLRLTENSVIPYVMNELNLKTDALINNIFLGGGEEEYIIKAIHDQIFDDWKNDPINCQIISETAKNYVYQVLCDRKPWLEKFLYKKDFVPSFGFSLKSKDELVANWTLCFLEATKMVIKYRMIDDKLVYRIGKYVVVHVDERLSLDDVGNGVFLNASYISHIFKKVTGMAFVDFMTEVKIDRAKVLLRDKDKRVFEIANTLGYSNQEYFAKKFKMWTGFTPTEYQKYLLQKYSDMRI